MEQIRIGIIMNGVTGRMGTRQHLDRSIVAIRDAGGIELADGRRIVVDPILVGRNPAKLEELAKRYNVERWTTDLDQALANPDDTIYFDAQTTDRRAAAIRKAIAAGKHIFCEKPTAITTEEALDLARLAQAAGVKNGVVQDKLFLPGIRKLKRLIDGGFFGDLLSFRLNFGYWVFEGDWQHLNRPSWNYRREDGGGLILDMYPHWRYLIDNTVSPIKSVMCHGAIHVPNRWDEEGKPYTATAEDAAYGLFELENGVVAQFTTSWTTRPYRDEIGEWQLDGTHGSAIAGLRDCKAQARANTPMPVWNPDIPNPIDFRAGWLDVPDNDEFTNAFRIQWEMFLRHICEDAPWTWDLLEGAKGVQLAELALQSWEERRWIDVPELTL
ncbi:MAG: Gfo/Idh/MocA family protein [Beutenbergiaceae bacterium]